MKYDHFLHPEIRQDLYRHLVPEDVSAKDISEYLYNNHRALFDAESYALRILPFSQRYGVNMTLHDTGHAIRVIENINLIVDCLRFSDFKLSPTEMEILYISGWFHDIGMLISSHKDHVKCSVELLKNHLPMMQISEEMRDAVCSVILSHGKGIDDMPVVCTVGDIQVRLRNLCSILCIADLCDYNDRRAPKIVYDILEKRLNEEEKGHWLANIGTSIEIKVKEKQIVVNTNPSIDCSVVTTVFEKYIHTYLRDLGLDDLLTIEMISYWDLE